MRYDKDAIKQIMMDKAGINSKRLLTEADDKFDMPIKMAKGIADMVNVVEMAVKNASRFPETKNDVEMRKLLLNVQNCVYELTDYLDDVYEWDIM